MSADNITQFPGSGEPDNPLQLAPRHAGVFFCSHDAVVIDKHHRTVRCANTKCGATLDAFDFLLSGATTIGRAWESYRHAQRETAQLVERVHELKKEERRLRAMVERLQKRSGSVLVTKGS